MAVIQSVAGPALAGGLLGFVMSSVLVAAMSERHPLGQFMDTGFEVAAADIVG